MDKIKIVNGEVHYIKWVNTKGPVTIDAQRAASNFDTTVSCQGCPHRHTACSMNCEGFAVQSQKRDKIRAKVREEADENAFIYASRQVFERDQKHDVRSGRRKTLIPR